MTLEYDERLKECPFCKGEARLALVEFNDGDTWFNPQCTECDAGWYKNYETKEEAIEAWNKRKL